LIKIDNAKQRDARRKELIGFAPCTGTVAKSGRASSGTDDGNGVE
jgi:hypothetical protein